MIDKKLERLGEKHTTNEGCEVEIIEYFNKKDCSVLFTNGVVLKNRKYKDVAEGRVKNPYHPSVHGLGCIGQGLHKSKEFGKNRKVYSAWNNMLKRCYTKNYHIKQPSYKECSVDERWHNFQNFAGWYEEKYKEGFHLDKDILFKNNKIYSPETCCFIPPKINSLFTKRQNDRGDLPIGVRLHRCKLDNYVAQISIEKKIIHLGTFDTPVKAFKAYKTAKEFEIKRVADECIKEIEPRVHRAMYNYKVEITD